MHYSVVRVKIFKNNTLSLGNGDVFFCTKPKFKIFNIFKTCYKSRYYDFFVIYFGNFSCFCEHLLLLLQYAVPHKRLKRRYLAGGNPKKRKGLWISEGICKSFYFLPLNAYRREYVSIQWKEPPRKEQVQILWDTRPQERGVTAVRRQELESGILSRGRKSPTSRKDLHQARCQVYHQPKGDMLVA